MTYATMPTVVSFVAKRLNGISKNFSGSSATQAGLPGMVPAPLAGASVKCLTSDGNWTTINTTNINPNAFTEWASGKVYDVVGIFLTSQGRMFRVLATHFSTQIDADLAGGKLQEVGGMDGMAVDWMVGGIYNQSTVAVFNSQLIQCTATHVSTGFAADCLDGKWKFIANTGVSSTPFGVSYYSFMGHTVVQANQIWACITPHVASSWIPGNWLSLQKNFTGATPTLDGISGSVPGPLAGQDNFFLRGDGVWADAAATGTGINAGTAAAIATLTSNVATINSAITGLTSNVSNLSSTVSTLAGDEAGGVNSAIITTDLTLNSSHKGLFTAVDTTAGPITLTMPASPAVGDTYSFTDASNTWGSNAVTLASNLFHKVTQTAIFDVSGSTVTLKYINSITGWIILAD